MAAAPGNVRKDSIKITRFINPHKFWFKYDASFIQNEPLFALEMKLQTYAQTLARQHQYSYGYEPKVDEVAVVMNVSWNKWVRVNIDHIVEYCNRNLYACWAIDHGVLFTSESRYIRPLCDDLADVEVSSVFCGGIANIVPATMSFNFTVMKAELTKNSAWSENAVAIVDKLLTDAASIMFTPTLDKDGHIFGSIEILRYSGEKISPDSVLFEMNLAMTTTNFPQELKSLESITIQRWQKNNGNADIKSNENKMLPNSQVQDSFRSSKKQELPKNQRNDEVSRKVNDWNCANDFDSVNTQQSPIKPIHLRPDDNFDENVIGLAGALHKNRPFAPARAPDGIIHLPGKRSNDKIKTSGLPDVIQTGRQQLSSPPPPRPVASPTPSSFMDLPKNYMEKLKARQEKAKNIMANQP